MISGVKLRWLWSRSFIMLGITITHVAHRSSCKFILYSSSNDGPWQGAPSKVLGEKILNSLHFNSLVEWSGFSWRPNWLLGWQLLSEICLLCNGSQSISGINNFQSVLSKQFVPGIHNNWLTTILVGFLQLAFDIFYRLLSSKLLCYSSRVLCSTQKRTVILLCCIRSSTYFFCSSSNFSIADITSKKKKITWHSVMAEVQFETRYK